MLGYKGGKTEEVVLLLTLIVGLGLLSLLTYQYFMVRPLTSIASKELTDEFNALKPMPNTSQVRQHSEQKMESFLIGGDYDGSVDFQALSTFYKDEFGRIGWQFQGESPITVWGKDYGGRELHFKKSNYYASLWYPANDPRSSITYSIDLVWSWQKR